MKYTQQNKNKSGKGDFINCGKYGWKTLFCEKNGGKFSLFSWYSEGDPNSGKYCLF